MSQSFHGTLAVGKDKDNAVANYRAVKMGKGVVSMSNETDSFLTDESFHSMFNPTNGELDLDQNEIPKSVSFVSENSDLGEANWMVCSDGCGNHIVYEKDTTDMKFCPVCASALQEPEEASLSEEDMDEDTETPEEDTTDPEANKPEETEDDGEEVNIEEDITISEGEEPDEDDVDVDVDAILNEEPEDEDEEDDSEDDDSDDDDEEPEDEDEDDDEVAEDTSKEVALNAVVVASSTFERARANYLNTIRGKGARAMLSESGDSAYLTSAGESIAFDPTDGDSLLTSVSSFDLDEDEKESLSSDDVEYKVCSSDSGCGSHVISSEEVDNCPVCSASLCEPDETEDDDYESDSDDEDYDESESGEEEVDVDVDVEDDGGDEEVDVEIDAILNEEPETDKVSINLLDDASDKDPVLSVSWSKSFKDGKDAWLASLNGMPVAYATRDTVGENNDIFDDSAFARAVISQSKDGAKYALEQFGFKPFVVEMSVSQNIEEQVSEKVAEAKAKLDTEAEQYQERFLAAMSTAAIGLNRGFFANTENPLKAQIWESLNTVGVEGAEVLIDNVFSSTSDSYHKVLFDKTIEILGKSVEVQEELAHTVLGTNYQRVSASNSASQSSSVGQLGKPVLVVDNSKVKNSSIADKLRGIRFNSQ